MNQINELNHYADKSEKITTPTDQQDIFRQNCFYNDIFLRLKNSHCTMETQRSLNENFLNIIIPFEKKTLQEHT